MRTVDKNKKLDSLVWDVNDKLNSELEKLKYDYPNSIISKLNILDINDCKKVINLDIIPNDVSVSTMTVTCKTDTCINVHNIGKYVNLKNNGILSVKYGDQPDTNRSILHVKQKKKKGGVVKRNNFFNQITVEVKPTGNNKINIKLFKNGSIQLTGCKSMNNLHEVLMILAHELMISKAVIGPKYNEIIPKPFLEDNSKFIISDIMIRMINTNFKMSYKIDRDELYRILINNNIKCTFEPCVHAGVNIKFVVGKKKNNANKEVSIFVFESGSIIITGASDSTHVLKAYNFITTILDEHHDEIVKTNIKGGIDNPDIQRLLQKMFK